MADVSRSNGDPDPAVFDLYFVALDRALLIGEAFAAADVETPAVPVAFDDSAVKP